MIHTKQGKIVELESKDGTVWKLGLDDVRSIKYFEGVQNNQQISFAVILCYEECAIIENVKRIKVEFN